MFDRLNTMTFRFSITLIAIVSLLGIFVASQDDSYDDSDEVGPVDGKYGWHPGNATFYGHPNAAGPPDNGNKMLCFVFLQTREKKKRCLFLNDHLGDFFIDSN